MNLESNAMVAFTRSSLQQRLCLEKSELLSLFCMDGFQSIY